MQNNNLLAKKYISANCGNITSQYLHDFSDEIMRIFLEMGSETPCNINCYNNIEYGVVKSLYHDNEMIYGMKLKGKNILISDIMNMIEDINLPDHIQRETSLTDEEWNAVTRIITMILISLECYIRN
jgi:hypothetical protein